MNEEKNNIMNMNKSNDVLDPLTQEYSDVVTRFWALRDETVPDDTLHDRVFSTLFSAPVTTETKSRYSEHEGAPSGTIPHFIHQVFSMQNNWKTFAPVAVVVLLVGVAVVGMSGKGKSEESAPIAVRETTLPVANDVAPSNTMMMAAKTAPESSASGNIDDIIDEIDREADGDSAVLADSDQDAALVNSDSQVISDYAQAYDETSF
jgi:hypothetical protein